jgi:hypothetical protein
LAGRKSFRPTTTYKEILLVVYIVGHEDKVLEKHLTGWYLHIILLFFIFFHTHSLGAKQY